MTATDELRRLLDGRGVKWTYGDGTVSYASGGRWFHAWAYNDDTMCVSMGYLTPAQAVEATLGSDFLAENAKLRELVRDMHKAFVHGNCYQWCEFKEPCNYISDGRCQWYDRMRELGVEI